MPKINMDADLIQRLLEVDDVRDAQPGTLLHTLRARLESAAPGNMALQPDELQDLIDAAMETWLQRGLDNGNPSADVQARQDRLADGIEKLKALRQRTIARRGGQ
jgi:hypothetical protein